MRVLVPAARCSAFLLLVYLPAACSGVRISAGRLQEFPPGVTWGGRAVAVAVHPNQPALMLVASESGGLFKSDTRGLRWIATAHLRYWSNAIRDVEYVPGGRIVATTAIDLSEPHHGGIWLSGNGALSFRRPTNALPPSGPRCPERTAAYGIAVEPASGRVYVGTDCGYAWSDDGGRTWSHKVIDPLVAVDAARTQDRILNIVAAGRRVYALGKNGLYSSPDAGATWTRASTPRLPVLPYRDAPPRLAISPVNPMHAFLALDVPGDSARLYLTVDGGATWRSVAAVPDGARQSLVRTTRYGAPPGSDFMLYWGDGTSISRSPVGDLTAPVVAFSWTRLDVDHADINDLAFDGETGEPLLLASDGGVHLTDDGGLTWRVTGSGIAGYRALQVYGVTGQFHNIDGRYDHTDLYFGTQDNALWFSTDGGATWTKKPSDPEGGGLGALRSHDGGRDAWITGYRCWPCFSFLTEEHFRNSRQWDDAGDGKNSEAIHLGGTRFLQFGTLDPDDGSTEYHLFRSEDFDSAWTPTLQLDRAVYGSVKVSRGADLWLTYGVRETASDGTRRIGLRSIGRADLPAGGPRLYDAAQGIGSLGARGYQYEWTPVFGVHPSNPNFIIAPDIAAKKMMVSTDGGVTWTEDVALEEALTDTGAVHLYARYNDGEAGGLLVTEISFLPENPNHILVGTTQNGIVHSADGGLTWRKIPGSEDIPHVTSFFWDYPNGRVIVSSYGRGLWVLYLGRDEFDRIPDRVREIPPPDPGRPTLEGSATTTVVTVDPAAIIGGTPIVPEGTAPVVRGAGFRYSPDQQSPVLLRLDGDEVARAFPDQTGRFQTRLAVSLTMGTYVLEAVQKTPEGLITQVTEFAVGVREGAEPGQEAEPVSPARGS
ncbi:MAG TPA: sialidase family protein [Longimicrobiales bacterium]